MSFETLFAMLGPAVGLALGVAIVVMGVGYLLLWKVRGREIWSRARSVSEGGAEVGGTNTLAYATGSVLSAGIRGVMPVALAAGFIGGYAMLFDLPAKWDDEIWKWVAVSAAVAGILVAVGNVLSGKMEWMAWVVLAAAVGWLTARRIPEDRGYYMAALAGTLILYLAAYRPAAREGRLWLVGAGTMLVCGMAAVAMMMPFELNHGRLFFVLTGLIGLVLLAGFVRPLRIIAADGVALPAAIFAVLTTTAAFYMVPETYPRSVFFWLGAAPLGAGVAWVPWLRKRPWRCAIAAVAVAGALLVPAIVIAMKNAPPMDV